MARRQSSKHLAGWITVGLYAINPQSQRCKWIAIDTDYHDAFFDLGKLKSVLELDGVSAALEMSRRGGHLWIFCERPLLAEQCRVYIYNVALRLGFSTAVAPRKFAGFGLSRRFASA